MTETATRRSRRSTTPRLPGVAIVDPELMRDGAAACDRLDRLRRLSHAFESFCTPAATLHRHAGAGGNPPGRGYLPAAVDDGRDLEARAAHGLGRHPGRPVHRQRRGDAAARHRHDHRRLRPQVMHGEALAVTYPEFIRFTWASAPARFAALGRILDPAPGRRAGAAGGRGVVRRDGRLPQGRRGIWSLLREAEGRAEAARGHRRRRPRASGYPATTRIAGRGRNFAMLAARLPPVSSAPEGIGHAIGILPLVGPDLLATLSRMGHGSESSWPTTCPADSVHPQGLRQTAS